MSKKFAQDLKVCQSSTMSKGDTDIKGPFPIIWQDDDEDPSLNNLKQIESKNKNKSTADSVTKNITSGQYEDNTDLVGTAASLYPSTPPTRRYDCSLYQNCLEIAGALNWETFSCTSPDGQPCSGSIDQKILWQAHLAQKDDQLAKKLFDLPNIDCHETESPVEGEHETIGLESDYTYCERIRAVKK